MPLLEDDEAIRALLARTRRIAVLGIKAGEADDAFRVPRYLQTAGYRILPINPKLERVLDERCAARLSELDESVDLIDVFRDSRHLPGHAEEILALSPRPGGVWLQLGISDDGAIRRLCAAGIDVVRDRCLMVEHARLFGRPAPDAPPGDA